MSEDKKMNRDKRPYEGHRKRLRERCRKTGFEGFHDYEVLELLLTYAIPRKDTKPVAKTLISKFRTIQDVLDAPLDELSKVEGLGENSALFIKTIREIISEYFKGRAFSQRSFRTIDDLVDYLKAVIGGSSNEIVHVLYLNSKNELIHSENLSEGTVSEAVVFPRKIVEGALKHKATSVILAHNHPGGLPEPYESDDRLTDAVRNALKTVDVMLQEHVIISKDEYYSYRRNGYF
ncbi:MAG: DNA repair protein RadC [Thermodesulfovibrionales bacterium]|nr:DNA repair protein RadC [Thermodesulfovibrionales bacterium]